MSIKLKSYPVWGNSLRLCRKPRPPRENWPILKKTPPVLALIHKPGQVQSQIALSLPSVKRTHPDYWKISLLTNIFGGDGSLMSKRLRDDLGLVYSAGFYETYKWSAGVLFGYIGCKGDQSVPAISETIKIMRALGQTVPQKELDQKRLDALNSFVFNVDTPADLVRVYARYYMRNEPLDTLEKIQDAFFSAKKDDLRRLAAEYLVPDKIQIFWSAIRISKSKAMRAMSRPWKICSGTWPTHLVCPMSSWNCVRIGSKVQGSGFRDVKVRREITSKQVSRRTAAFRRIESLRI